MSSPDGIERAQSGTEQGVRWGRAIGGAAFLACSWTWCIGMWLPVILLKEFGWPGFVVFAVPNVAGGIAMGLALSRPGLSERVTGRHGGMIRWFALATIAFHAFFVTWRIGAPFTWIALPVLAAPAAILLGATMGLRRIGSAGWRALALAAWPLSIVLVVAAGVTSDTIGLLGDRAGTWPLIEVAWLAPVMALGFLACPFLDPTFHRVRRELPGRTGDAAFVLGFGVLFVAMISLTALYAYGYITSASMSFYVVGHLLVQSMFTCGALGREVGARSIVLPVLLGLAVAIVPYVPFGSALGVRAEGVYRMFMGFYGLVFPAYVWIVMVPRRRPAGLVTWAIAVALAAPLFWFGFLVERWICLVPGALIVLVAPLIGGGIGPVGRASPDGV